MVRFKGVGAGKGSQPRDIDKKKFDENFDKAFGVKKASGGYSQWCMHGKWVVRNGKEHERCDSCEAPKVSAPFVDCFGTPRWNQGLGCYTSSIRETERIAKRKGLEPIGNERVDKVFKQEDKTGEAIKRDITEMRGRLRAQMIREGKL